MDHNTGIITRSPPVFCDWLDATFPAESSLHDQVGDFLSGQRCLAKRVGDSTMEYRHPDASWGNFQLHTSNRGWSRLSASGGSCEALRATGTFGEYLAIIGDHTHTVTRLDATMDLRVDAPPIISKLVRRYPPDSLIYLTRKGVSPGYNLQPSLSGGLTGTFMAGPLNCGKSKVSARVYDKQAERLFRTGVDPGPWVRYEVTVRKGLGASVRDAYDPLALFWNFASPALLPTLPGVSAWLPSDAASWGPGVIPLNPTERLRRRVDDSVDLENLLKLADDLGVEGRRILLRHIRNRIGLRSVPIAPAPIARRPVSSPAPAEKSEKLMWQQGVGFIQPVQ